MNADPSPQQGHNTILLEFKNDQERRARFLRSLVLGLIALHLAIFPVLFVLDWTSWATWGISLSIHLLVYTLNRYGKTAAAAHIFSGFFNLHILAAFVINTIYPENGLRGVLFGSMLALNVLLAGMLVNRRTTLVLSFINVGVVAVVYLLVSQDIFDTVGYSIPTATFIILVAIVSWLYQRSLERAQTNLRLARDKIMRDELRRQELEIARDVQHRLQPPPPRTDGVLDIVSHSAPARETSGDFYDFISLGPDEIGIVMGDVSGKSLPAALIMAMARSTMRVEARRALSPAQMLAQVNQVFCDDPAVNQLVTAFYGILNLRTLTLCFASAGHPYPILRRAGQVTELELNCVLLGAFANATYSERSIQLQPGDELILLSDGVFEERNQQREIFGYERLLEVIRRTNGCTPPQLLAEISAAITSFRGEAEQNDDITMIVIRVRPEVYAERVPPEPWPVLPL